MPRKKQDTSATIGKRLAHFRTTVVKLSANKFSTKHGINQSQYSKIERDEAGITTDKALEIANAYGMNLHWLYTGTGSMYIADAPQTSPLVDSLKDYIAEQISTKRLTTLEGLTEAKEIIALLDKHIASRKKKP